MKYKKYKIVKEFGKFYIDIPFFWKFWERLTYTREHEVGTVSHMSTYNYSFDTYNEAYNFAEEHKYEEFK